MSVKKNPGLDKLRHAVRRITSPLNLRDTYPTPEPADEWQRAVEVRMSAVEKTINDQNRLLLLTIASIVLEIAYRAATK